MKKKATIRATFDIEFEDNGDDALVDQAHEAGEEFLGHTTARNIDVEVVGSVEDA